MFKETSSISSAALAVLMGLSMVQAHGDAADGPKVGDQDLSSFYRWTQALPERPGVMLREEPIAAQPEMTSVGTRARVLYTPNQC
jgi:hypothetical protein